MKCNMAILRARSNVCFCVISCGYVVDCNPQGCTCASTVYIRTHQHTNIYTCARAHMQTCTHTNTYKYAHKHNTHVCIICIQTQPQIPYFTGYKSRLSCSKPALYTMGATYTPDATYTGYESCDELDYEY